MPEAIVTTPSGRIEGEALGNLLVFRGIPFARPPAGEWRFRPPERLQSWGGVRPARRFSPSAPQNDPLIPLVRQLVGAPSGMAEDCLYLNVWTPAADARRRPVMVWIHGGAFVLGSGATSLYWGHKLAAYGEVVVVTINYRLGVLGYLNTTEYFGDEIPANLGVRDQIAALEWVRDHIEAFGGDPTRVTIFGESAGGMSVGTLLGTPSAKGLFSRAVLQSGAAHNVSSAPRAAHVAHELLAALGPHGTSPTALRRAPLPALLQAQREVSARLDIALGILPWQPSVDGDVLPEQPLLAIRRGVSRNVPTLVGTNRDEWRLFLLGDSAARGLDEDALHRRFERTLAAMIGPELNGLTEACREAYGPERGRPVDRWCAFQSDRVFHAPAAILAEEQTRAGSPVYVYRFDWSPPLLGGLTGAFHGIEVPFVFGTLRSGFLRATLGLSPEARRLSSRMQRAWVAFAYGDDPVDDRLPEWPRYSSESRSALILAASPTIEHDLHAAAVRFFAPLLEAQSTSGLAASNIASPPAALS